MILLIFYLQLSIHLLNFLINLPPSLLIFIQSFTQTFSFSVPRSLSKGAQFYDLNNVNWWQLARIICSYDWSKLLLSNDTHLCSEHFLNAYKNRLLSCIPLEIAKRKIKGVFLSAQSRRRLRKFKRRYFSTHDLSRLSSIENIFKSASDAP